jgi:hypothetical protein
MAQKPGLTEPERRKLQNLVRAQRGVVRIRKARLKHQQMTDGQSPARPPNRG